MSTQGTWAWWPEINGSFGDNPVWDTVRVIAAVLAMIEICLIGRVIVEQDVRQREMARSRRLFLYALAMALLSLAYTELRVVGTVATPRLVLNVATVLTTGVALVRTRRAQIGERHLHAVDGDPQERSSGTP